jgi:hypothetical protein
METTQAIKRASELPRNTQVTLETTWFWRAGEKGRTPDWRSPDRFVGTLRQCVGRLRQVRATLGPDTEIAYRLFHRGEPVQFDPGRITAEQ